VPVWFVLDGEERLVMTGKDAIGGKNILLDSCVVSIDGEHPPFAFVLIEGLPANSRPWSTLVHVHCEHMGAEQAAAYGKRNAVEGELLVRVALGKVLARGGIAD
jgi:hypothetical protein